MHVMPKLFSSVFIMSEERFKTRVMVDLTVILDLQLYK